MYGRRIGSRIFLGPEVFEHMSWQVSKQNIEKEIAEEEGG